jgi:hypothetical protein
METFTTFLNTIKQSPMLYAVDIGKLEKTVSTTLTKLLGTKIKVNATITGSTIGLSVDEDFAKVMKPRVFKSLKIAGEVTESSRSGSYIVFLEYYVVSITNSQSKIEILVMEVNKDGKVLGMKSKFE